MTMSEVISANGLVFVVALALVALVGWWWLAASRRTRIERTGAAPGEDVPAQRNQALIDAAPAAAQVDLPPFTPEVLGAVSEVVAAAARPVHQPVHADDLKR